MHSNNNINTIQKIALKLKKYIMKNKTYTLLEKIFYSSIIGVGFLVSLYALLALTTFINCLIDLI